MTRGRDSHAHVDWKHLAVYGVLLAVVLVIGGVAVWSFVARQALAIEPEPLPKITVVGTAASSPLAAAWVKLLTRADMQTTLVQLEQLDPIEGVILFCDVPSIPPPLLQRLETFVQRGGSLAFAGQPPVTAIGKLHLEAEPGRSDATIVFSQSVSPVLARLRPGHELRSAAADVAFLEETPRMIVDARWKESARAAVMHMEVDGSRYLWFGLRPDRLVGDDPQLHLLLRTAFRWVAGQPVSDGAIGAPQLAKTLTPDARLEARKQRFAFSVDRQKDNHDTFTIRMSNRGPAAITNPTVRVWLPPGVKRVALSGDLLMRRNATLTGLPEDGSCLVSVPRLSKNQNRVIKLRIAK